MSRVMPPATSLATVLSLAAFAQEAPVPAAPAETSSTELERAGLTPPTVLSQGYEYHSEDRLVSRIVGQTVYTSAGTDARTIGTISDLVLTEDGTIGAVVIDVGGFLGIGQKPVAVDFSELQQVADAEGKPRFMMTTTAEALQAAPAFIWADSEEQTGDAMTTAQEEDQLVEGDPNAAVSDPNAVTDQQDVAPLDRTTLNDFDPLQVPPGELVGLSVQGIDQQIGTVNGVLTDPAGAIDALVVDVGGFLGLGAKPVAVGFDSLTFATDVNDVRYVFLNATAEQLEAQPAYDPATYETDRDAQRLVIAP